MMLIDAFQPEGVTRLAVDSIFMMPHLGVLAQVNEQAATEVFVRDCLINLGTCVAMVNQARPGAKAFDYILESDDGTRRGSLNVGEVRLEPLADGKRGRVVVEPSRRADVGEGRGRRLEAEVAGGVVGVVFDARGRPLVVPRENRSAVVDAWAKALDAYPR